MQEGLFYVVYVSWRMNTIVEFAEFFEVYFFVVIKSISRPIVTSFESIRLCVVNRFVDIGQVISCRNGTRWLVLQLLFNPCVVESAISRKTADLLFMPVVCMVVVIKVRQLRLHFRLLRELEELWRGVETELIPAALIPTFRQHRSGKLWVVVVVLANPWGVAPYNLLYVLVCNHRFLVPISSRWQCKRWLWLLCRLYLFRASHDRKLIISRPYWELLSCNKKKFSKERIKTNSLTSNILREKILWNFQKRGIGAAAGAAIEILIEVWEDKRAHQLAWGFRG